jgi:hypothetical protein
MYRKLVLFTHCLELPFQAQYFGNCVCFHHYVQDGKYSYRPGTFGRSSASLSNNGGYMFMFLMDQTEWQPSLSCSWWRKGIRLPKRFVWTFARRSAKLDLSHYQNFLLNLSENYKTLINSVQCDWWRLFLFNLLSFPCFGLIDHLQKDINTIRNHCNL